MSNLITKILCYLSGLCRGRIRENGRTARKLMTMCWALNPRKDVARIYLPIKEEGRGLISVEDSVKSAILGFETIHIIKLGRTAHSS